jgi:hypothetical protein
VRKKYPKIYKYLGGYAAFRYLNGKLSNMLNDQDKMLTEWKKQLYYEHNRDTSLRTSESKKSFFCY